MLQNQLKYEQNEDGKRKVLDGNINHRETTSQVRAREGIKRSLERKQIETEKKAAQQEPVNFNLLRQKEGGLPDLEESFQNRQVPVNYNQLRPTYNNRDLESDVKLFASQQKDIQEEDVDKFTDFFLRASENIKNFSSEFDDIGQHQPFEMLGHKTGSQTQSPGFHTGDQQDMQVPATASPQNAQALNEIL